MEVMKKLHDQELKKKDKKFAMKLKELSFKDVVRKEELDKVLKERDDLKD